MSEKKLFELILAIKRKCQSNEDRIQVDLQLSQAEFNSLIVLNPGEEILGNELADRMALSPSRSSRVLGKLLENGYVTANYVPEDRRSVRISLTDSGRKMKTKILDHMGECETRICANFDDCQIDRIKESLELLVEAL